jgi:alkylresorcinol/alkylpyrone synthase
MPRVISVGTADAPYKIDQSEVKSFIYDLFSNNYPEIDRMINVFDNSSISRRHFSVPVAWLNYKHSFSERNKVFIDTAFELTQKAIKECLANADAEHSDIDCIIFITSTGLSTPTIDALLFNELKLKRHIKRIPLWGLGCAGGASGITRGMEYTKANPKHNALVVAVELCSLTFQKDDLSKSNIIATSLFSDGCAAAFISGDETKFTERSGADLIDSLSTIYTDSLDIMGWDIVDSGFKVLFSKDIPTIVKDYVEKNVTELLSQHNLTVDDIKHYVTHPGGAKVISAYEESLGLTNGKLDFSRKVLKEHGNMSSPSVLYVLKEFLNHSAYGKDEHGLISSLGPGFSSELILFKTA